MCEKKFLLYETVNSNYNNDNLLKQLVVLTVLKKYKIIFFFQKILVSPQNELFLGFVLIYFVLFFHNVQWVCFCPHCICRSSLLISVREPVTNGHHLFICILFAMVIGGKLVTRVLALAAK